VVEDDPVGVVDDLSFVAELDRLTQSALADRPGIDIVKTDQAIGRIRHHPGQSAAGLPHDLLGALQQGAQIIDRSAQPSAALAGRGAHTTAGVTQHCLGIGHRGFGDTGQLCGDPQHRSLAFLARGGTTQAQLGGNRTSTLTRRTAAVSHPGTPRPAGSLNSLDRLGDAADSFSQQTRIGRIRHRSFDHRRVGSDLVGAHQLVASSLDEQGLVEAGHRTLAAPASQLHQRRRVRHPGTQRNATEPLPGNRITHLTTERLIAQSVAELQKHHPQIGLHRN
jgi:hypothetical protein